MKLLRVFPRLTRATPTDKLARVGGPTLFEPDVDEIHVSVTFTWDLPIAECLAAEWQRVAPVKIGGPALGDRGAEFEVGRYLKPGFTITSRGCPNRCWFCDAWKREGSIRELEIKPGWNILDNNLLACSSGHVLAVFEMLAAQKREGRLPTFTGGLEAALLEPWHVDWFLRLKPDMLWFAYDEPADWGPLIAAVALLREAGLIRGKHRVGCYVLCGWQRDSLAEAEKRMAAVAQLGIRPMAMLYNRGEHWPKPERAEWRRFARGWASPVLVGRKMREIRVDSRH